MIAVDSRLIAASTMPPALHILPVAASVGVAKRAQHVELRDYLPKIRSSYRPQLSLFAFGADRALVHDETANILLMLDIVKNTIARVPLDESEGVGAMFGSILPKSSKQSFDGFYCSIASLVFSLKNAASMALSCANCCKQQRGRDVERRRRPSRGIRARRKSRSTIRCKRSNGNDNHATRRSEDRKFARRFTRALCRHDRRRNVRKFLLSTCLRSAT